MESQSFFEVTLPRRFIYTSPIGYKAGPRHPLLRHGVINESVIGLISPTLAGKVNPPQFLPLNYFSILSLR